MVVSSIVGSMIRFRVRTMKNQRMDLKGLNVSRWEGMSIKKRV